MAMAVFRNKLRFFLKENDTLSGSTIMHRSIHISFLTGAIL